MQRVRDREQAVGLDGNLVDLLGVVVDGAADAALAPVLLAVLLADERELGELVRKLGPSQAGRWEDSVAPQVRVGRRELGREGRPEVVELGLDLPARGRQAEQPADDEALDVGVDLTGRADLMEGQSRPRQ